MPENAEQQLDKVYHAIPEWVHREFPNLSLAEKIELGFERINRNWTETHLRQVNDYDRIAGLLIFVMASHGLDYATEYWAFLAQKEEKLKKDLTSSVAKV